MIRKFVSWFRNCSLSRKITMLVLVAAVLPIGIMVTVSLAELKKLSEERQLYAVTQGYSQVRQAVEDKLSRIHNISTLLAVSDMVNVNLRLSGQEQDIAEQLANFESISSYAYGIEMTFEASSIVFYIDNKPIVVNNQSRRYRSIETAQQTEWYERLEQNNGMPTWVSFREETSPREYVAITRKLWDSNDFNASIGVLAVLLERQSLEDMLVDYFEDQVMYLETGDGCLLAANVPEEGLVRLALGERELHGAAFRRRIQDGTEYLVCSSMLDKSDVYLVSLLPVKALEQEANAVTVRLQAIYVSISLFILLSVLTLTRSVTRRIQRLKNQMTQLQNGVVARVEVKDAYNDEIGQLLTRYNETVGKVEELMREQYALGQEKTEAELKALQSQINPHFLYNTLDMINWMAQKNETENIRDVVQAMSRFYRRTLSKGQNIVTIADEVMMCEAYMEIQKRRYRGRILYEVEVEEGICECLIPKITLQPFLENAIVHGINEKEDARGVVILNGWMEDGRIILSVTDDGNGMVEADKRKSDTGSHYGMKNISRRLELYYGEEIPIQVESSLGVGTCIIINIPVRRQSQEGET